MSISTGHSHTLGPPRLSQPLERAVVVIVALKVDGADALSGIVVGIAQVAPVGAPVHVREAVPETPAPPMDSGYVAVWPAVTVAEVEPPGAAPSPILVEPEPDPDPEPEPAPVPVPLNATICGPFVAASVIVSDPLAAPAVTGEKVTLTEH